MRKKPGSLATLHAGHRRLIHLILAALWLTGVLWLGLSWLPENRNFGSPSMTMVMKIHGAFAMLTLVALGSMGVHIKQGWGMNKNRLFGCLLLGAFLILGMTGWGLYYLGSDFSRHWTSLVHGVLGLLLPIVLVAHVLVGRK